MDAIGKNYEKQIEEAKSQEGKVSIIIPIYNTEKYLRACFDSVIAQSYTNWEILAVDDGSTDGSAIICDEYEEKDKRIKVFHQQNMRIAAARNKGLENAKGHYITFLDSDDMLMKTALETALRILSNNDADMVQWCAHCFITQENPYEIGFCKQIEHQEFVSDAMGALEVLLDSKGRGSEYELLWNWCRCVWTKLCKREVFNGIFFPVGKEYEDDYLVHRLFLASGKTVFINDRLTCYRGHSCSTLHKMGLKGRFDKMECEYERFLCMLEVGNARLVYLACHIYFTSLMNTYLECKRQDKISAGGVLIMRAKKDIKKYGKYLSWVDKMVTIMFYRFPGLFGIIWELYRKVK